MGSTGLPLRSRCLADEGASPCGPTKVDSKVCQESLLIAYPDATENKEQKQILAFLLVSLQSHPKFGAPSKADQPPTQNPRAVLFFPSQAGARRVKRE